MLKNNELFETARPYLLPGAFILVVLLAAWRIVVIGVSEHYARNAEEGDLSAIDKALSWNGGHPRALFFKARQLMTDNPVEAERLLRISLQGNPADGQPAVLLAELLLRRGKVEDADALIEKAVWLMPASPWVRLGAGEYWLKRQKDHLVIENWSAALTTNPALSAKLFPVLLTLAENEKSRPLFSSLVETPPNWWEGFISFLAEKARDHETLVAVMNMRKATNTPLTEKEREHLVRRLERDRQWPLAYLEWASGLSGTERQHLGSVYNGGFELEPENRGFDWYLPNMKGVIVSRARDRDAVGEKVLKLEFTGQEMSFAHLYQLLYLPAGKYIFNARVRVDGLATRGGLHWSLRCADNPEHLLGESERMLGASEWRTIGFNLEVPDESECLAQVLRLESTGKHLYDHKLQGTILFDQIEIRRNRQ